MANLPVARLNPRETGYVAGIAQQFVHSLPLDVLRRPAVAVLINFGIVAGRKPTRDELQALAAALRAAAPVFSIIDEQRFEVGEQLDVLLEEVRIEVPESSLALADVDAATLETTVISIAERWVSGCAADPGSSSSLAERIARQAVVDEPAPPD